jgi:hypothetical protein
MAKSNENEPISVSLLRGSIAADMTGIPGMHLPKKSKILSIALCNKSNLAADNTNYVVVSVKNGALLVAKYDSRAAGQGALAAGVSKLAAMDPNAVLADHPAAGSDLTVDVDVNGTGSLDTANLTMSYVPL